MASNLGRWRYSYTPLVEPECDIRLLTLLPSNDHDDLRCSLSTISLEQEPLYIALSYEWGEDNPDLAIDIIIDNKLARIRPNLFSFLQQLKLASGRYSISDGAIPFLWVDALCINQNDKMEKASQVKLMSRIFQKADHVFAWIGPRSSLDPKGTFDSIRDRHTTIDSIVDAHLEGPLSAANNPPLERLIQTWQGIAQFLNQTYWSRRWVIQEIILAKRLSILWDDAIINWEQLEKFLRQVTQRLLLSSADQKDQPELHLLLRSVTESIPSNIELYKFN